MIVRRVVLTISQLGQGGAERQVVLLARGLQARGIDVAVATLFRHSLFGDSPREAELDEVGIPVTRVALPWIRTEGVRESWRVAPQFVRFVQWLHHNKPQVVHAFLPHAYLFTPPAARLARVPAVVAGRRSLGNFKDGRPIAVALERVATAMTDVVVANSEAVARDTIQRERLPAGKVKVIYNGLASTAFDPALPAKIATDRPIVLCVAHLWQYKRLDYLLRAAAILQEGGLPVTVVLAGQGPAEGELQALATNLGIDARFLGQRSDVPSLIATATVFALPTLLDGMSNALMEAMAAGLPVVATDSGGNRETVGPAGLLVPPSDPHRLAEALAAVLRDTDLATRLGQAAREHASRQFSEAHMVDEYINLYDCLVQKCAALPAS